jgi:antitoxin (DNA-binding transcriptional repressor) of toxin-antitoxin stability system
MKAISIHDAKTNLSKYIAAAKRGEKVYIGSFGEAEVVLTKIPEAKSGTHRKRSFEIAKGKVKASQDAFTDAADREIAELMFGK